MKLILVALFTFSLTIEAKVPNKHRTCKTDDDCEMVGTGGCCADDLAINKQFVDLYKKPTADTCKSGVYDCPKVIAVCKHKQCIQTVPKGPKAQE